MNRAPLRRLSARRLEETSLYRYRRKLFLLAHPYCQVWLAEHGVEEETAIRHRGAVTLGGVTAIIPLATEVHHKNKRRGGDLLDERFWLAVSREAHEQIEAHKSWARAAGWLRAF